MHRIFLAFMYMAKYTFIWIYLCYCLVCISSCMIVVGPTAPSPLYSNRGSIPSAPTCARTRNSPLNYPPASSVEHASTSPPFLSSVGSSILWPRKLAAAFARSSFRRSFFSSTGFLSVSLAAIRLLFRSQPSKYICGLLILHRDPSCRKKNTMPPPRLVLVLACSSRSAPPPLASRPRPRLRLPFLSLPPDAPAGPERGRLHAPRAALPNDLLGIPLDFGFPHFMSILI